MKRQSKAGELGRRDFLRTLGVGGAAVAAAAPLVGPAAADTESNDEKRKARYQPKSPHVQTFYRVNRYPTK
ncbi:MAG: twin-arginine translocation signal domain-containing protein [Hyphomicrobiales bacterium]|nr:twin-arginine translocation signal domain-containing protein [Hyphomicrobiales bacterium]